jgi:hypothetical protein
MTTKVAADISNLSRGGLNLSASVNPKKLKDFEKH